MNGSEWRKAIPAAAYARPVARVARPGSGEGTDRWLFWAAIALSACGLVMVYSSSSALGLTRQSGNDLFYLQNQTVRWVLGVAFMLLLAWPDARPLSGRMGWAMWGGLALLLALMLLPLGIAVEVRGAKRWVPVIGVGLVQPSEFARVAMLGCLAGVLSRSRDGLRSWRSLAPPLGIVVLTSGLIAAEPHLSLAILTAASGFLLIFLAGASLWRLAVLMLACGAGALVFVRGYHIGRIKSFFEGTSELGYQAYQSKLAIGSGGLTGLGLGDGLQKYFFLPDPHTDFILSIAGEEAGLLGILGLFALTAFVIWRIFRIGRRSAGRFHGLLAYGIGVQFLIAFLLHAAVCLVVAPTTGVPYPLVSFGGSALVSNMMAIGLVLSVSRRATRDPALALDPVLAPSWAGRVGR